MKASKSGSESDFHLMISKSQEEMYKKLSDENLQLKEAMK